MAFVHGKKTVFKLDNSAGTLVDLSAYINQSSLQRLQDLLDTTCFGATAKTYITGFPDAKIPFGGFWDATLDAHMDGVMSAINAGTLASASFELYPEGNTSGKVKYSGEALLISYEQTAGSQQATGWSGE